MFEMASFFNDVSLQETMMNQLVADGQKSLASGKWSEAVILFEQAQALKRWPGNDQASDQMVNSSLALAFSQMGNLSAAKHYV